MFLLPIVLNIDASTITQKKNTKFKMLLLPIVLTIDASTIASIKICDPKRNLPIYQIIFIFYHSLSFHTTFSKILICIYILVWTGSTCVEYEKLIRRINHILEEEIKNNTISSESLDITI